MNNRTEIPLKTEYNAIEEDNAARKVRQARVVKLGAAALSVGSIAGLIAAGGETPSQTEAPNPQAPIEDIATIDGNNFEVVDHKYELDQDPSKVVIELSDHDGDGYIE